MNAPAMGRRAERPGVMPTPIPRAQAIAALDAYHAASIACRGYWRRPEGEQRTLDLELDRARAALDEAARGEWAP